MVHRQHSSGGHGDKERRGGGEAVTSEMGEPERLRHDVCFSVVWFFPVVCQMLYITASGGSV